MLMNEEAGPLLVVAIRTHPSTTPCHHATIHHMPCHATHPNSSAKYCSAACTKSAPAPEACGLAGACFTSRGPELPRAWGDVPTNVSISCLVMTTSEAMD